MGEEEILEQTRPLAAPFVFFIVFAFQFATKRLQDLKRGASKTSKEMQLRGEIKQLLKEAASYSQPSTFAQAAKLRRMAAAKEKELANYQAHLTQEVKQSYDLYLKILFIAKVYLCATKLYISLYTLVGLIGTLRDYGPLVQGGCYPGRFGVLQATISGLGSFPGWYCVLGLASALVDSPE